MDFLLLSQRIAVPTLPVTTKRTSGTLGRRPSDVVASENAVVVSVDSESEVGSDGGYAMSELRPASILETNL